MSTDAGSGFDVIDLSPSLVGLGVSALDVVALVDRFPEREAVQPARGLVLAGGGPVATACAAAATLGCPTAIIDVLGDDWIGNEVVQGLLDAGVDCSLISRAGGARSSMAVVWVESASGRRSIAFHPGTTPVRHLQLVDKSTIASSRCLHLNGRHWPICLEAASVALEAGVPVSFDGGAGRYREELDRIVAIADVSIVAAPFAAALTGETRPEEQIRVMQSLAPGIVGVTCGEAGSWMASRDVAPFHQTAYAPRRLVDTTGCGDAYHGAFLFGWLEGRTLQDSARLASAVAALSAGALGGRAGLPELADVEAFLNECEPIPVHGTTSQVDSDQ